ncbi:WD40/YVTN/BNR-like repeat-containing protein [Hydrocarboniphaga sp.]|uniref:WD40/YVTN/BNR-like repeat-containing protein n=1 Tax=Hydrocarboniphaga sp. TaxID=2033016 RepID=UPI003D123BC1
MARTANVLVQPRQPQARAREAAAVAAPGAPSLLSGWPALLLAVIVAGAAVYSFSHRPLPPFPQTVTKADGLLVTGLAQSGERRIAVGELGRILIADAASGPWREVKVTPQRGSTFTRVIFTDANTAIAVGHDGWIVRSTDRGETWHEVVFDPERGEAVLGVAGPFDGRLYAYGAFGQFLVSTDNGQTWLHEKHGAIGDRHLAAMVQAQDGSLVIVGETGLMARSVDQGASWTKLPEVYKGSFYGLQRLPSDTLLAFGMRGNAYLSDDNGQHWTRSNVPGGLSLYDSMIDHDGHVVLVGENSSVFRSTDNGRTFSMLLEGDRKRYATVLPVSNGSGWLVAGEAGIALRKAPGELAAADANTAKDVQR